jgi:dihydrofolate reductase
MRKLISLMNVTPDGFCNHADVIADDDLHIFVNEIMKRTDTSLFGRITFQLFEEYWPVIAHERKGSSSEIEFADIIDHTLKIVFSKTLKHSDWSNSHFIPELTKDYISQLKEGEGKDIIIMGSPSILSKLAAHGLIDQYYFIIQPMLSGKGKRLFEAGNFMKTQKLNLTDAKHFSSGAFAMHYTNE